MYTHMYLICEHIVESQMDYRRIHIIIRISVIQYLILALLKVLLQVYTSRNNHLSLCFMHVCVGQVFISFRP